MTCTHKKNPDRKVTVSQEAWQTTVLRMIRAEQESVRATNLLNAAVDASESLVTEGRKLREAIKTAENWAATGIPLARNAGIAQGQEQVLSLIARWGKCRPLDGYNGLQMSEALRKVLTPTIAPYDSGTHWTLASGWFPPYTDYNGTSPLVTNGTHHSFNASHKQPCALCNPIPGESEEWIPVGNGLERASRSVPVLQDGKVVGSKTIFSYRQADE